MKPRFVWLIAIITLFAGTHRLPAPIQEVPESQSPIPSVKIEPESTPTRMPISERKPPKKSAGTEGKDRQNKKVAAQPTVTERNPKRFAGTWSGTMYQEDGQTYRVTVMIDQTETQASANGPVFSNETGTVRINDNTLSWKWMLDGWSMTLKSATRAQLVKRYLGSTHTGTVTKIK